MHFSLAQIVQWLLAYKYFILFPIAVIEGPIVTVAAGFSSSLGYINPFLAYGVIIAGEMVGDSAYYWLGRWKGVSFVNKFGRYIGLKIEHVKKVERHYTDHAAKTVILGKFAYSLEVPFLLAAGLSKVPYRKFLSYVFVASLPKSLIFILIGYYSGEAYNNMGKYLNYASLAAIAIAAFLIIIYVIIRKISQKYAVQNID